jgi:serine/threonine-protein kinase
MGIHIGQQLGSLEVAELIGRGGMGEVYRARDTKLKRDVAIKVLPDEFACDGDRVSRFQREAEVLASLNHPNIAAIYDLQEVNETRLLVLELVDGQTLAERIQRGPIPVEEALEIGRRICEALEAAHDKGIIHRDLKPANVKITPDGNIKVLDFGLAKAMEKNPGNPALSNSPTLVNSFGATNAGVIIGTAAYMSPEQARGFAADPRSDIFAFGCVLYEMLTGQQAFQGETVSDILASVLAREPDFTPLPKDLSPRLLEFIRRCLEKNRKRRWHCAGDLRGELETLAAAPKALPVAEQVAQPQPALWRRAIPIVATAILVAGIAAFSAWHLKPSTPLPVTRFQIPVPDGQQLLTFVDSIAVSPDGTQMVYVANNRIYLRSMSDFTARPISGTESQSAYGPVFSPDSRSIAFTEFVSSANDSLIKQIAVTGGAPVTLYHGFPSGTMQWAASGIVLADASNNRILQLSPSGGAPQVLISPKNGETRGDVQLLPGGQAVLYTVGVGGTNYGKTRVVVQSLKSSEPKVLVEGGSAGRYVPTGQLVYMLGGTLFAVPFDLQRLEVTGGPMPAIEGVLRSTLSFYAHFQFSNNGTLVYLPGPVTAIENQRTIGLLDRNGEVKGLGLMPGNYGFPRISPNGKRVAFEIDDGKEASIWIYDLSGASSMRKLTFTGANRFPIWSADGEHIAFQSDREGDKGIFWQRADGTGTADRLTKPDKDVEHIPDAWSPDGQKLSFTAVKGDDAAVWIFSRQDKKSTVFAEAPGAFIANSVFSPNGKWLAYQSSETKSSEIFVQPFPATGTKYQITKAAGSHHPLWSPDGKEVFFIPGPTQLSKLSITTEPSFSFGDPVSVPNGGFVEEGPVSTRPYDITPDGKRLIGVIFGGQNSTGTPAQPQIHVVLNWFEELKQRVAAK